MSRRKDNDIACPDGYIVGGLRKVRSDGTILFQRGWWQAPMEWVGEKVWVHEEWSGTPGSRGADHDLVLEAAPPGMHIYEAQLRRCQVVCRRTKRPDAKPNYRSQWRKDWAARSEAA